MGPADRFGGVGGASAARRRARGGVRGGPDGIRPTRYLGCRKPGAPCVSPSSCCGARPPTSWCGADAGDHEHGRSRCDRRRARRCVRVVERAFVDRREVIARAQHVRERTIASRGRVARGPVPSERRQHLRARVLRVRVARGDGARRGRAAVDSARATSAAALSRLWSLPPSPAACGPVGRSRPARSRRWPFRPTSRMVTRRCRSASCRRGSSSTRRVIAAPVRPNDRVSGWPHARAPDVSRHAMRGSAVERSAWLG
jgi:hypothetical protein